MPYKPSQPFSIVVEGTRPATQHLHWPLEVPPPGPCHRQHLQIAMHHPGEVAPSPLPSSPRQLTPPKPETDLHNGQHPKALITSTWEGFRWVERF